MPETYPVRVVRPFVERWTEETDDGRVLGPFTHRGEEITIEQRSRARTQFPAKLLRAKARYAPQPLNDVEPPPARRREVREVRKSAKLPCSLRDLFSWPSAGNSERS